MQPYFLPYIGYFQLINSVDKFVICDNMQYTRRGWFNRNRILNNGNPITFTIPLKKAKAYVNSNQRYLADNSVQERTRILKQIQSVYQKAPYFSQSSPLFQRLFIQQNNNLFDFIHFSIVELCSILDIKTEIIICSSLDINHELKSQVRIVEICKFLKTNTYINMIGGKELYSKESFNKDGITLRFIKSKKIKYTQFNHEFVPLLSIIDILMFNDIAQTKSYLNEYEFE